MTATGEGFTVWFTGLPCSGKSTLADLLLRELERRGREAEVLDGDVVRKHLSKGLTYSKNDRDENIRRIGFVCRLLSRHGVAAIAAAISPYREIRDEVRATIPRFIEVYVRAAVEVCEVRDVKGMYRKARAGEIKNFTGVDDPYEEPLNAEVVVHTDRDSPEVCLSQIIFKLEGLGLVNPAPRSA